jgi:hypothetical protein
MDGDDSVICEETGVNANQIKTANFNVNRLPESHIKNGAKIN